MPELFSLKVYPPNTILFYLFCILSWINLKGTKIIIRVITVFYYDTTIIIFNLITTLWGKAFQNNQKKM